MKDEALGLKAVHGATVFAVDPLCNLVYYYNEAAGDTRGYWKQYNSARWDWFKRVKCTPETLQSKVFKEKYSECEKGRILKPRIGSSRFEPTDPITKKVCQFLFHCLLSS